MKIERLGFINAVFVCGTQEKTISTKEGKVTFEDVPGGVVIHDIEPGRSKRKSSFPSVLVPWSNIAYAVLEKEEKPAPKAKKEKVVAE